MPAGGAEIGTFLSYSTEKALTKHPEEFGHGAIEGVAGPEAANNASAAGTLVPLLTLGLPTSATAAIMLAGFQQFGLQPGPLLFATNATLVWSLIASLLVANLMLLVLNLPLVGLWVRLLAIPRPWLYAGILTFATLGTIGANPSPFELGMLLALRPARLRAAPLRLPDRAGRRRPDPRPARRAAAAPGAGDQPGRPVGARSTRRSRSSSTSSPRSPSCCRSILRLRGKGQVLSPDGRRRGLERIPVPTPCRTPAGVKAPRSPERQRPREQYELGVEDQRATSRAGPRPRTDPHRTRTASRASPVSDDLSPRLP